MISYCDLPSSITYFNYFAQCFMYTFWDLYSPPSRDEVVEVVSSTFDVLIPMCGKKSSVYHSGNLIDISRSMMDILKQGLEYLTESGGNSIQFGFREFVCQNDGSVVDYVIEATVKLNRMIDIKRTLGQLLESQCPQLVSRMENEQFWPKISQMNDEVNKVALLAISGFAKVDNHWLTEVSRFCQFDSFSELHGGFLSLESYRQYETYIQRVIN